MGNKQIELSIVVVIEPHRAGRKSGARNARLGSYIGELTVAEIVKQVV
jgi:hypothetical protein